MDPNMDLTYHETIKFIYAYKKQVILWNPHVLGYYNKKEKELSWKIVAAESDLLPYVCKKKITSLLTSYRRAKQKVVDSRQSGKPEDVILPSWRYWNAFKFLRGLEDNEEDPLGTAPEMDVLDPSVCISKLCKKKVKSVTTGSGQLIDKNIAKKMRKMYPNQREFTKNIIMQILKKGFTNSLTSHSKIWTPGIQKTAIQSLKVKEEEDVLLDQAEKVEAVDQATKNGVAEVSTSSYVIWSESDIEDKSSTSNSMEYFDFESKIETHEIKLQKMEDDPLRDDNEDLAFSQEAKHLTIL